MIPLVETASAGAAPLLLVYIQTGRVVQHYPKTGSADTSGYVRDIDRFNAGAGLLQTGLSFAGKTVPRHFAVTGPAPVHPVRTGPVPVHFGAGHLLGVPAHAG